MSFPAEDAFEVAMILADALEEAQVPYAIGGALAYGLWGDPRGTHDVDINLFVEPAQLDGALTAMERAGTRFDRAAAHRAAAEGDVLIGDHHGMRIDVFTPSIPFSWEAGRTRVRVEGPTGPRSFLSAEATVIFKLLFYHGVDPRDPTELTFGSTTRRQVCPPRDVSAASPPWCRAICRTRARPSPTPPWTPSAWPWGR